MAEISDQELARLRSLEGLVNKLEADPRSSALIDQAVKIHHPEVVTQSEALERAAQPLLKPVQEQLASVQETLQSMIDERKAREAAGVENTLNTTFANLKSQHGFTDDGINKIQELMVERKIADPEAAAALFLQQNPPKPTEAPSWQPSGWDMGATGGGSNSAAEMEALFKDEDGWADRKAAETLNSIRVGQAA